MRVLIILLLIIFAQTHLMSQQKGLSDSEDDLSVWLELLEDQGTEYEDFIEILMNLRSHAIEINRNDLGPLLDLQFINLPQSEALKAHKEQFGPLLSIEELQSIPGWDIETILRIRPLIKVNKDLDDLNLTAKEILSEANYSIATYLSQRTPNSVGYSARDEDTPPAYEGSPYRHYVRMRAQYGYALSVGLNLEKDAGETMFSGSNKGYDYTNFHLYAKDINKWVKHVALGDYRISMGQGLIIHNGFGSGKSAEVTNIKRGGRFIRPHTSTSEIGIYTGGAIEIHPAKNWIIDAFYSQRKRDANVIIPDTFADDEQIQNRLFTSLQTSGLHRTKGEIEDEKALQFNSYGGRLAYRKTNLSIEFNALHTSLNRTLQRTPQPYNQFLFNGDQLTNMSISYSAWFQTLHLFGETARSDNGALAHLIGLKTSLLKNLQFVSMYRHYPRNYQNLEANAFGETRTGVNEVGFYTGLNYTVDRHHSFSTYADFWKHPWLRFGIDAPSAGEEYMLRYRYYEKRRLEFYVQYRLEIKDQGINTGDVFRKITKRRRDQLRFHLAYKINKALEWRGRVEYNRIDLADEVSNGYMLYQDIIYRPIQSNISFSGRYMFFDTDNGQNRIYTYENNLLYNYSLPSFANTGHRYYLNVRYRPLKFLTIEGRIAQIIFSKASAIGSGSNEVTLGNKQTELAGQIRFTF